MKIYDISQEVFLKFYTFTNYEDILKNYSLIDYNRAGVPLLELVTEPDLHSADEAVAFLEHMRCVYQYLDISEADSKKGQIRCDVNISLMEEDATELGTKVEIKNINSFTEAELEELSSRYDEIIEKGYLENNKVNLAYIKDKNDELNLIERLETFKENHLLFAYDFSVEFTNNTSEKGLR